MQLNHFKKTHHTNCYYINKLQRIIQLYDDFIDKLTFFHLTSNRQKTYTIIRIYIMYIKKKIK